MEGASFVRSWLVLSERGGTADRGVIRYVIVPGKVLVITAFLADHDVVG